MKINQVLNAKSERSLRGTLNHNCVIRGITKHPEYGVIFELEKVSTGFQFNIDILNQDDHSIVLSQGREYRRYRTDSRVLWNLRPSVLHTIIAVLDIRTDVPLGEYLEYVAVVLHNNSGTTDRACTQQYRLEIEQLFDELITSGDQADRDEAEREVLVIE